MERSKALNGLANGLSKRLFLGDTTITDEVLKQELFADMDDEQFNLLRDAFTVALNAAAREDMDTNKLEALLSDKKYDKQQIDALLKTWKAQRVKVHDTILKGSSFTDELVTLSWRIDVQTKSRHIAQLNEPTAVLELNLGHESGTSEPVRFEVDEKQLKQLIADVDAIDTKLNQTVAATKRLQQKRKE